MQTAALHQHIQFLGDHVDCAGIFYLSIQVFAINVLHQIFFLEYFKSELKKRPNETFRNFLITQTYSIQVQSERCIDETSVNTPPSNYMLLYVHWFLIIKLFKTLSIRFTSASLACLLIVYSFLPKVSLILCGVFVQNSRLDYRFAHRRFSECCGFLLKSLVLCVFVQNTQPAH